MCKGESSPFLTNQFNKEVMTRSKLRNRSLLGNRFSSCKSNENKNSYIKLTTCGKITLVEYNVIISSDTETAETRNKYFGNIIIELDVKVTEGLYCDA